MNRKIVIGGNLKPDFNSCCLWPDSDISQNPDFYIIKNQVFITYVCVIKKSPEGKELRAWLNDPQHLNNTAIQSLSLKWVMPTLVGEDITQLVVRTQEQSFEAGYKKAQFDIRRALGV